jgi:DNA-binding NarL/FixJ family response regulator
MPEVACLMLTSFGDDEALFDAIMAGRGRATCSSRSAAPTWSARCARWPPASRCSTREAASKLMARLRDQAAKADPLAGPDRAGAQDPRADRGGLTNRQIGERMFLAEKTVKNYVSALFAKLGMERRTQAAAYAARVFGDQHDAGSAGE